MNLNPLELVLFSIISLLLLGMIVVIFACLADGDEDAAGGAAFMGTILILVLLAPTIFTHNDRVDREGATRNLEHRYGIVVHSINVRARRSDNDHSGPLTYQYKDSFCSARYSKVGHEWFILAKSVQCSYTSGLYVDPSNPTESVGPTTTTTIEP